MYPLQYSSDQQNKNRRKNESFLKHFFFSSATKFLGEANEGELLDDGTWKYWNNTRRFQIGKWLYFQPWHKHIRGRKHGIVDDGVTHVPCVAVDLDRHNNEPPEEHLQRALSIIAVLPEMRWQVEMNPENGSVHFLGYRWKPIPIDEARAIAKAIHDRLNFAVEVFPHNLHALWLPLNPAKITLGIPKTTGPSLSAGNCQNGGENGRCPGLDSGR
jgi:hypothetical protein